MIDVSRFRDFFATKPGLIHLNNAGLSPINREAEAIVEHWIRRYRSEGMFCNDDYMEAVEEARGELASFLGAESSQLAFFTCTSAAISQVAFGIGLQPQDEVLLWDQEYGSNLYPWQEACVRSGAVLVQVHSTEGLATPIEKLLEKVTAKTRVIALSWVQFQSGALTDLGELSKFAREKGILTVIDGIQAIGVRSFSFKESGIDVLVGGSHKWLTAPVGVGYLCLTKDLIHRLKPICIGSATYGSCDDPADLTCIPKRDASRFESGSKQVLEILALGRSAKLIASFEPGRLGQLAVSLAQRLADGLRDKGYRVIESNGTLQSTPIVTFKPMQASPFRDIDSLTASLVKNRISFARRGPGLRLSPHAHNSVRDIEQVLLVCQGKNLEP